MRLKPPTDDQAEAPSSATEPSPAATPPPRSLRAEAHAFAARSAAAASAPPELAYDDVGNFDEDPSRPMWPKQPVNTRFYYIFRPTRWDCLEIEPGGARRVLPVLAQVYLNPGANGAQRADGGRTNMDELWRSLARNEPGAIVLVEGHEYHGFQRRHPVPCVNVDRYTQRFQVAWLAKRTGGPQENWPRVAGYYWCSLWENPIAGSEDVLCDARGYATWLGGLVDQGVLPAPGQQVLSKLFDAYLGRHNHLVKSDQVHKKGESFRAYEAALEAVRTERARQDRALGSPTLAPPASGSAAVDVE